MNSRTSKTKYNRLAIITALILIIFNLSLFVLTAVAHGPEILAESSPPDGAQLSESPQQITMVFTAELQYPASITAPHILEVYNLDGDRVDLEDAQVDASEVERPTMAVSLPTLDEGVYMVRWSVSPTDGDIVNGLHFFSVGELPDVEDKQSSGEKSTAGPAPTKQSTANQTPVTSDVSQSWRLMIAGLIAFGVIGAAIYFRRKAG